MPKLATAMPLLAVETAVIGAMKPKDEPRIARQHVPVDQQKQCGGHSREEQGGGRVEARGENQHQEGGTEHGDDVLCADTGGAHPSQTFIGLDYLAGRQRLAVAMQLPLEDTGTLLLSSLSLGARHSQPAAPRTILAHEDFVKSLFRERLFAVILQQVWIDGLHHIHQIAIGEIRALEFAPRLHLDLPAAGQSRRARAGRSAPSAHAWRCGRFPGRGAYSAGRCSW